MVFTLLAVAIYLCSRVLDVQMARPSCGLHCKAPLPFSLDVPQIAFVAAERHTTKEFFHHNCSFPMKL